MKFKTILPIALVTLLCLFIAPCAFAEEAAEVSEPVIEEIVPQAETPVVEQVIESKESYTGENVNPETGAELVTVGGKDSESEESYTVEYVNPETGDELVTGGGKDSESEESNTGETLNLEKEDELVTVEGNDSESEESYTVEYVNPETGAELVTVGGKDTYLSEISGALSLGIEISSVESVVTSNDALLTAEKLFDANNETVVDWIIHSLSPFATKESLTVNMLDAPSISIDVYDANYSKLRDQLFDANNVKYVEYLGQKWMVIGFNTEGCGSELGTMTLLKSDIIERSDFDDEDFSNFIDQHKYGTSAKFRTRFSNTSNEYNQSNLQTVMEAYYEYLKEKYPEDVSMISPRTLKSEEYLSTSPYCDGVAGLEVEKAMVWPLSTAEAASLANGIRTAAVYWWLRSPGDGDSDAACVSNAGYVSKTGDIFVEYNGVRPALWVNLESVIIESGNGSKDSPYVLGKKAADPDEDQTAGVGVGVGAGVTAVSVYVDGELLTYGEDYVFVNGKVQLTSAFLKTLDDGNHTLEIRYDGGYSVSETIEVKNGEIVKSEYKYLAA